MKSLYGLNLFQFKVEFNVFECFDDWGNLFNLNEWFGCGIMCCGSKIFKVWIHRWVTLFTIEYLLHQLLKQDSFIERLVTRLVIHWDSCSLMVIIKTIGICAEWDMFSVSLKEAKEPLISPLCLMQVRHRRHESFNTHSL